MGVLCQSLESVFSLRFSSPDASRVHPEDPEDPGAPFETDRERVLYAQAFRRLGGKTQVFSFPDKDHSRTRLTHSLEVGQIARRVALALGCDPVLSETMALAHDIGHPPFGHAGEDSLRAAVAPYAVAPYGPFDHNQHTLERLTRLERRSSHYPGLNLTRAVLEGLIKHNWEKPDKGMTPFLRDLGQEQGLDLRSPPGPEAQIAALADDIAYNVHDLEDGLSVGLFASGQVLEALPWVRDLWPGPPEETLENLENAASGGTLSLQKTILTHRLLRVFLTDLQNTSLERATQQSSSAPGSEEALVGLSPVGTERLESLRVFLKASMYRHPKVTRAQERGKKIVRDLFDFFIHNPQEFARRVPETEPGMNLKDPVAHAHTIAHYIAGMTDRFAVSMWDDILGGGGEAGPRRLQV